MNVFLDNFDDNYWTVITFTLSFSVECTENPHSIWAADVSCKRSIYYLRCFYALKTYFTLN